MDFEDILNLVAVLFFFFSIAIYHFYLLYIYRTNPLRLVFGLTNSARRVFVASIMARKDSILAVQTMRNWVMMASSLASTAIVVIIGLTAFLSTIGTRLDRTESNPQNPIHFNYFFNSWFPVKLVTVILCLVCAFFFFAQAMRFFNHTIISINVEISEEELAKLDPEACLAYRSLNPDVVADMLNRGAYYNSVGIRCYYVLFPLLAWVGGSYYFIGTTVILLVVLRRLDFNVNVKKHRIITRSTQEDPEANQPGSLELRVINTAD